MAKIYIGKADCLDNETFEQYASSVGLNFFDDEGDPRDVDSLTFEAKLLEAHTGGCLTIYKSDLDESTFQEILQKLEADASLDEVHVKFSNPELS